MSFTELESQEIGIMFRCDKCHNISDSSDMDKHDCGAVPSETEVEELNILGLLDSNLPSDFFKYIKIREIQFKEFIGRMEAKFPPDKVRPVVMSIISQRIATVGKMREACYEKYAELRKNGVSYEERRKSLDSNRIAWCDREEARLVSLSMTFKVRKWSEFLWDGSQVTLRIFGLRGFINLFLEHITW